MATAHSNATGSSPFRLDRAAAAPLWLQLRADLERRLEAGEFSMSFPGELELRNDYGVSRYTVREALRALREAGTVTADRGRAPRVSRAAEISQPLGALYSLFKSVEEQHLSQRSVVLRLDAQADAHVSVRLGLEESTPLVRLERLRLADDQPLAIDCAWLPASLAAPLLSVDFTHTALYDELATHCGIRLTGGHERIRAAVPAPAQRQLLDVGPESAVMVVERMGLANGVPVEWRTSVIRGDRFSVLADFSATSGYTMNLSGGLGVQP